MKQTIISFLLVFLPLMASADAVEIDGIFYNLVIKAKQAEVTINPNGYFGDVVIPETVTYENIVYDVISIRDYAFSGSIGLTSVAIPNSMMSIGNGAFYECDGLSSVHISDIGAWCNIQVGAYYSNPLDLAHHLFMNGEEIKDLIIPNSVTSIGENNFCGCSGLTSVTIPNSVTTIGKSAFQGCNGLTYVNISNSVTSIGEQCFLNCTALSSVSIPNSITEIDDCVFYGCSGLTSVIIPSSVISIGRRAFYECNSLSSVVIPNSVTFIGEEAFYNCRGLTYVVIPNSVTSICKKAFFKCNNFTSVTIGSSVTYIGEEAFYGCSGLTSLTIPNSVTSIGSSAFAYCSGLTSLTIGESVNRINSCVFANCLSLNDVYCLAENVPNTNIDAYKDSYIEYTILHVPAASLDKYKNAEPWKNFKNKLALESGDTPVTQKCATPEISYANGKVSLSCETQGVDFISEVIVEDVKKYYDSEFTLSQTYKISAYATKVGYENSDTVTREIVIENGQASLFGDLNKDGKVNVADHVKLSNIIMNK